MIINPHRYQQKMLESKARFILAAAGIQSGKTMGGVLCMLQDITNHIKDDFIIAAPTYKILAQATLPKFFEFFPLRFQGRVVASYEKQNNVLRISGGGNIYIRSVEDPNSIEGITVRSVWLDEAGMMKPAVWTNALGRVSVKKGKIYMTTTPYTVNWLYNEIERQANAGNPDFEVIRFRSIDNPYFPREEYENAKKLLSASEFERRYEGEFRKMTGLVLADFQGDKMTYSQMDNVKIKEVIAGVDYGYTNPFSIQVVKISQTDDIFVDDEVYESRKTIPDQVAEAIRLKKIHGISQFYVDPSAPALIEALNQANCPAMPADNDIDTGISKLQALCKGGKLHVNLNNTSLLDEIDLYHYKILSFSSERNPQYRQKPEKINDHAVDALRYVINTHPIEIEVSKYLPAAPRRMNRFFENMKRMQMERRLRIERYGDDYGEEDRAVLDQFSGI